MPSTLYNLFQNFLMGGAIVSSISYIGTFMDPLLGAIWWSFPISLLPTLYFMKKNKKSNKYIAQFALSTTFALILLLLSCFCLYYFINRETGLLMPILKSAGIWLIASTIFYYMVKDLDLEKKFL